MGVMAMAGMHLSIVLPKNGKASVSMVAQMQLLLDRKICVILLGIFSLHSLAWAKGFGRDAGLFFAWIDVSLKDQFLRHRGICWITSACLPAAQGQPG